MWTGHFLVRMNVFRCKWTVLIVDLRLGNSVYRRRKTWSIRVNALLHVGNFYEFSLPQLMTFCFLNVRSKPTPSTVKYSCEQTGFVTKLFWSSSYLFHARRSEWTDKIWAVCNEFNITFFFVNECDTLGADIW